MAKTAIRPEFFANLPVEKAQKEGSGITDEERFLFGMSETSGWRIFFQKKENLLHALDEVNEAAIANGSPREQIGENTIVISQVKGLLKRLFNIVFDAREACTHEQPTGGK